MSLAADGFTTFAPDARVARWAQAARRRADAISQEPQARLTNLRHGDTWFVGVDALPNDPSGAIDGVPLAGPWSLPDLPHHRAQLSIIYPGYPKRDPEQSAANHAFRADRKAAHVDGLLPEGPEKRRFAREFHAYILGIPLNQTAAAPTVVWRGSHQIVQRALQEALADADPAQTDVTEAYHAARKRVFQTCDMVRLPPGGAGTSFLIHRFALHGTETWEAAPGPESSRMIAFFRPAFPDVRMWLEAD